MARRHFSSQALVLIVISIAINMIGGQLASMSNYLYFSTPSAHLLAQYCLVR